MKIAIVFLFVLVKACWAQLESDIREDSIDRCIDRLHLNRDRIIELNKEVRVDENNEDMLKFFKCHARDLGVIDSEGKFVLDKLIDVTEARLRKVIKNVPDVEEIIRRVSEEAVEHCKDSPVNDNLGLQAIKMRNCIRTYTNEHEELSQN